MRRNALPIGIVAGLAGLLALTAVAARDHYALRVTSDTPTFLAVVRALAVEPLEPVRAFLAVPGGETAHATPYMQGLAWLWRATGPERGADGLISPDPQGLAALFTAVGVLTFGLMLLAIWLWTRRLAGSRAAWISIPCVLLLFGPPHVIWAGDHSFHASLYAGFYPQQLALALLLLTLLAMDGRRTLHLAAAALGGAATLAVHPFTGLVLIGLITVTATYAAVRRRPGWWRGPAVIAGAVVTASAWPATSVLSALGESGLPGLVVVAIACSVPALARCVPVPRRPMAAGRGLARRFAEGGAPAVILAALGLALVVGLSLWALWLARQPHPDPLIEAHRVAVYWGEDRWRWLLLLGPGALGVVGVARLARRGRPLPAAWLAGALALGAVGALGGAVPTWWRFLLFCQVPLAAGLAVVLADPGDRLARRLATTGLACAFAVKVFLLLGTPATVSYLGTPLQDAWRLGDMIPPGDGLVATDPYTSYFVPATTGRRVLVVTKAHVGSQAELAAAEDGYAVFRTFAAGGEREWWPAAREMYRRGVRHIVIDKMTLVSAPTLDAFSTGQTPLVRTEADRRLLGRYFYRSGRVGTLLHDRFPYVVYRLDASKLWPRA